MTTLVAALAAPLKAAPLGRQLAAIAVGFVLVMLLPALIQAFGAGAPPDPKDAAPPMIMLCGPAENDIAAALDLERDEERPGFRLVEVEGVPARSLLARLNEMSAPTRLAAESILLLVHPDGAGEVALVDAVGEACHPPLFFDPAAMRELLALAGQTPA